MGEGGWWGVSDLVLNRMMEGKTKREKCRRKGGREGCEMGGYGLDGGVCTELTMVL